MLRRSDLLTVNSVSTKLTRAVEGERRVRNTEGQGTTSEERPRGFLWRQTTGWGLGALLLSLLGQVQAQDRTSRASRLLNEAVNAPLCTRAEFLSAVRQAERELESLGSGGESAGDSAGASAKSERTVGQALQDSRSFITTPAESEFFVPFSTRDYRSLTRLRDTVGLPPPHGCAYVKLVASPDSLPLALRGAFDDPRVLGVTFLCRFVAIPLDRNLSLARRRSSLPDRDPVVNHELVHAYVNSALGAGCDALPKWFSEGTALYFSGEKHASVEVTAEGTIGRWLGLEYNEYLLVTEYVARRLGRKGFGQLVRAVLQGRPFAQAMREELGTAEYGRLRRDAVRWRNSQDTLRCLVLLASVAAAWVLLRRRRVPETKPEERRDEIVEAERRAEHELRIVTQQLEQAENHLRRLLTHEGSPEALHHLKERHRLLRERRRQIEMTLAELDNQLDSVEGRAL